MIQARGRFFKGKVAREVMFTQARAKSVMLKTLHNLGRFLIMY